MAMSEADTDTDADTDTERDLALALITIKLLAGCLSELASAFATVDREAAEAAIAAVERDAAEALREFGEECAEAAGGVSDVDAFLVPVSERLQNAMARARQKIGPAMKRH